MNLKEKPHARKLVQSHYEDTETGEVFNHNYKNKYSSDTLVRTEQITGQARDKTSPAQAPPDRSNTEQPTQAAWDLKLSPKVDSSHRKQSRSVFPSSSILHDAVKCHSLADL